MNAKERKNLQQLDELVLNASPEELEKIQEIDWVDITNNSAAIFISIFVY